METGSSQGQCSSLRPGRAPALPRECPIHLCTPLLPDALAWDLHSQCPLTTEGPLLGIPPSVPNTLFRCATVHVFPLCPGLLHLTVCLPVLNSAHLSIRYHCLFPQLPRDRKQNPREYSLTFTRGSGHVGKGRWEKDQMGEKGWE